MKLTAQQLVAASSDNSFDNGLTIYSELEPLGGPGAPVKPAVYAGQRYQLEQRWSTVDGEVVNEQAIAIDNVPSEANRLEAALKKLAPRIGLPSLTLDLSGHDHLPPHVPARLSAFDFPHRNADAYLRDSELDGTALAKTELGDALFRSTPLAPLGLLKYMPHALLYGFWQSHFGKKAPQTKLARSWTSEIVGLGPGSDKIKRLGLKGDPLNLTTDLAASYDEDNLLGWELGTGAKKGSKSKDSLAEIGHGQVPVGENDAPLAAVSFRTIEQRATLSIAGLRRIGTGDDSADSVLRALLASIGLVAHVGAFGRGFNLRSGADLVAEHTTWTWSGENGKQDVDPLDLGQAIEIFDQLRGLAADAGLPVDEWASTDIVLTPNKQLAKVIAQTFPELES